MEKKLHIMLIDDSPADMRLFKDILSILDPSIQYIYVSEGEGAIKYFNSPNPDIPDFIFLDVNMPRMDGLTCLKELRKIEKLKDVPIYMYSTGEPDSYAKEAMNSGAQDCLKKEIDIDDSVKTIAGVLKSNHHFRLN